MPPQPQVIVDIHMEQAAPNPDIQHIGRLISQDVGLAGTILKVVNSSLFGLKNNITSIDQAVQILGLDSIIRITEGISIKGELSDKDVVALGSFWDSAMEIASIAANIARDIGFQSPDKAYCLGLFHNCGVPLIYSAHPNYPEIIQQTYAETEQRVIDIENRLLRTNHAVVGYYVAKSWCLPHDLCEVISEHHNVEHIFQDNHYSSSYDHSKKTLMAILKMAEHICKLHNTLGNQEIDHEWHRIQVDLLNYVGFSEIDFEDLTARLENIGIQSAGYHDFSA